MIKKCMVGLIRLYQKYVSPMKPACCRFYPTCSSYAVQAISRFGVLRGGLLAFYRILRCQPLCKGGYDPVPEKFTFRRVSRDKSGHHLEDKTCHHHLAPHSVALKSPK